MPRHVIHRISVVCLTIVASFFLGAAYQNSAVSINGTSSSVTINASVTIPEVQRIRKLTVTKIRNTEYAERFSVVSNTDWQVVVDEIPLGVSVLAVDGTWTNNSAIIAEGLPTTTAVITLQYRKIKEDITFFSQNSIRIERKQ